MKRFAWFEILLIIVVMSMSLYAALSDAQNLSTNWFTRDDAYYYFKVAQNISEGRGSTFDGINPTNGYHPLWMLVCIPIFALARFNLILPLRILLLVMSGLSVATAILLFRLIGRIFSPPVGAIAALYWVFSYDVLTILYQPGLESGIAAFFIVLLVYKLFEFEKSWRTNGLSKKQLITFGSIAVLTLFSRLDLIFLASMIGVWIIFRGYPLRHFLPLDLVAVASSVLLSFVLILFFPQYYYYAGAALTMTFLALVIKIPLAYFMGFYEHSFLAQGIGKMFKQIVVFVIYGSLVVAPIMLVLWKTRILIGLPRTAILYDMVFTFLFFSLSRFGAMGLKSEKVGAQKPSKPLETLSSHWKQWLNEGITYYGIVFGALGIYMLSNKLAFGTFSPVSGQIKQWWATLPGTTYGGAADSPLVFLGIPYEGEGNAWSPISTLLGGWAESLYRYIHVLDYWRYLIILTVFATLFYILLRIARNKGKSSIVQLSIIPLLCSAFLQTYYYHAIGHSAFKNWYWVAQLVLVVLVSSLIVGILQSFIKIPYKELITWLIAGVVGISMGISFAQILYEAMPYGHSSPNDPYMDIVPFLEESTEPGNVIGMTGGGNAGYFVQDRTIVNMDGLINSYPYFQALKAGKAAEFLANMGINYILANPYLLDRQPYVKQFDAYLERTVYSYYGKDLLRFRTP